MDIKNKLKTVVAYISRIPVTGESQELAAMAKQELRDVIIELESKKEEPDGK